MSKRKQALVLVLAIVVLVMTILLVDGLFLANKRIRVKNSIIKDEKISEAFNNFKIVYFSDAHFNLYVNEKRLAHVVDLINKEKPDLVLFGGDLIDHTQNTHLTQEEISFLIDTMGSIKAPYGKFAVTGQQEQSSEYARTTYQSLMQMSEFEIIDDKVFQIHYQNDYINLIGVTTNYTTGSPDPNKFTLAFTHEPKNADLLSSPDLMIAGFTHGGQINIPLFNGVFYNGQPYTNPTQVIDTMRLDISNGVWTSKIDIRMFADGDILVYTLRPLEE